MKSLGATPQAGGTTVTNNEPRHTRLGARVRKFVIFASPVPRIKVMKTLKSKHIPFKFVQGCYKGMREDAYLIASDDLKAVKEIGLLEGEESVMHLGHYDHTGERRAWLEHLRIYMSGNIEDLGYFIQVSEAQAKDCDGWTFDPQTSLYYTTKKEI